MRKILTLLIITVFTVFLCSCSNSNNTNKPEPIEPKTETIDLTIDNWKSFFSIVCENENQLDAQGNIEYIYVRYYLELLPEYENRVISLSGNVGIEYESVSHRITNVNKQDGTWTDEVSNDYSDEYPHVGEYKPKDASIQVELERIRHE